jgi:hypothetical protein
MLHPPPELWNEPELLVMFQQLKDGMEHQDLKPEIFITIGYFRAYTPAVTLLCSLT